MILAGDFVPQRSNVNWPLWGDELVLANLEGPICENGLKREDKVGIHLHTSPRLFEGKWAFSLANNHLMDFCAEGYHQTARFLKEKGIPFAGAGDDVEAARQPMWLIENGKRIAVICCCERQFGVADANTAGVAAMGDWVIDSIRDVRAHQADYVIVSCHRGSEMSRFPSPRLVETYHAYIDAGADIVHGHHSHVPQGWEEYRGRPIFYGLGNFIVDKSAWAKNANCVWSLIVRIDFNDNGLKWSIVPYGDVPANAEEYLREANAVFVNTDLLRKTWEENCKALYPRYYRPYLSVSLRSIIRWMIHPYRQLMLRKCFAECETHVDIIETAKGV